MHTFAEISQVDYLRMIVCKQIIVLKTLSSAVDFDTFSSHLDSVTYSMEKPGPKIGNEKVGKVLGAQMKADMNSKLLPSTLRCRDKQLALFRSSSRAVSCDMPIPAL